MSETDNTQQCTQTGDYHPDMASRMTHRRQQQNPHVLHAEIDALACVVYRYHRCRRFTIKCRATITIDVISQHLQQLCSK